MLEKLSDLIAGLPVNSVLRERISLIKERAAFLDQRIIDLEKENSEIKKLNIELADQLAAMQEKADFVEHQGALFKRKAGGGYHLAVYCPVCKIPTAAVWDFPFRCSGCKWLAGFNSNKLASVMSTLPE